MKFNRKFLYPVLILIVAATFRFIEDKIDEQPKDEIRKESFDFYYLPSSTTGVVVTHDGYSLSYSEEHEQAEWVAYELKPEHITSKQFKRPLFELDTKIKTKSASWRNYKKSGYDKGHLCPAGDRRHTKEAFDETFLTSNISPQEHQFNSGVWNRLEKKTRYWANKYGDLYVITGGVLENNLQRIGNENVSVPRYFYKVILDYRKVKPKMIGFLMPHKESDASLKDFVVPVDKIESLTNIDFFPEIEDTMEAKLEANGNPNQWKF